MDCSKELYYHKSKARIPGAIVTLRHLVSDTVANTGIAIEINGDFAGWIRRAEFTTVSTLLANNSALGGVITSRIDRPWANGGGGMNYSGTVDI